MDNDSLSDILLRALQNSKGIIGAAFLLDEDHQKILEIETESEKRSLMGLGKVFNSGLREVLQCTHIVVGLTNMDFDWGRLPSLVLKKGDEVVGEEVRDEEDRSKLSSQENVWFMHECFVIYKDRMSFPKELMDKTCYFDTPCLPAEWCRLEGKNHLINFNAVIFANPSTLTDNFLKTKYFKGVNEKGVGTILVGLQLGRTNNERNTTS